MIKNPGPVLKPHLTKDELMLLPLFNHDAPFELITTESQALEAVKELQKETILGFDTETRPSFQKGEFYNVSLLQLASHKCCYLFRLNKIPLSAEIISILENPQIIKAGVGNRDDIIGLQKRKSFTAQGFVDLAELTSISKHQRLSLRALCGMYLGQRLSKGAKVTNWDSQVLSAQQAKYAANDAFVSLLIYEEMFPNIKLYKNRM